MWTINYKYIVVVSGFVFILYLYPTDKQPPSDHNMNIHTTVIKTTVATQTAHTVKTQTTQTDSTIQTKTTQTVHTTKQTRQTKNAHTQVEFDMTDFIIVDYCHKV